MDEQNQSHPGAVAKGLLVGAAVTAAAVGAAVLANRSGALDGLKAEVEKFVEEHELDQLDEKVRDGVEDIRAKIEDAANNAGDDAEAKVEELRTAWDELRASVKDKVEEGMEDMDEAA